MNNNEERDQSAERWLDAALERYTDTEPRPGFETRLLARIAAERKKATRWRALWVGATVAAAAAVLIIALSVGRTAHHTPASPQIANSHSVPSPSMTPVPRPEVSAHAAPPAPPRPSARHAVRPVMVASAKRNEHESGPKQPQFPTPAPLSEQERLALAYVQQTPKQEIETVLAEKQAFQDLFYKLAVSEQEKSDR